MRKRVPKKEKDFAKFVNKGIKTLADESK